MRTSISYLSLTSLLVSCVSSGTYDGALADAAKAKAELVQERAAGSNRAKSDKRVITALRADLMHAQEQNQRTMDLLRDNQRQFERCTKELNETTAMNAGLRKELEKLGKDVDALLATKGTLSSSLEQARVRLEELRRAQAAAESRAALFRDVALRFKRMLDAGELEIALRSGRMVLVLPNDLLFDSGKAELKPYGRQTLAAVAEVLATFEKRRFQVAGHTDDEAIRYSGFASNWELSTARALSVVRVLVMSGMRPETLSAAGYGQFDPLLPNDSKSTRAKNRRTEITLQPNIDELVALPKGG